MTPSATPARASRTGCAATRTTDRPAHAGPASERPFGAVRRVRVRASTRPVGPSGSAGVHLGLVPSGGTSHQPPGVEGGPGPPDGPEDRPHPGRRPRRRPPGRRPPPTGRRAPGRRRRRRPARPGSSARRSARDGRRRRGRPPRRGSRPGRGLTPTRASASMASSHATATAAVGEPSARCAAGAAGRRCRRAPPAGTARRRRPRAPARRPGADRPGCGSRGRSVTTSGAAGWPATDRRGRGRGPVLGAAGLAGGVAAGGAAWVGVMPV